MRRRFRGIRSRGRSNRTWTSQSASGQFMGYKSRKIRSRTFKRILWRDTLSQNHYRSSGTGLATLATGTTQGIGTVLEVDPLFIGTPGPTTAFYTATGGLLPQDLTGTTATFGTGRLVIRGGRVGITVSAPASVTDEIACTIWVVFLKKGANRSALPALASYGVMIDGSPDFTTEFGKVLYQRNAILNTAYPNMTVEHRLRLQSIDQHEFATVVGQQIAFIVAVQNLSSTTSVTMNVATYHDLSFSGDAAT